MDATTLKDKAIISALGQFVSVKQNVDNNGKASASKYKVRSIPTLLVLDSKGKVLAEKVGGMSVPEMIKFLNAAKAKVGKPKVAKARKG